MSRLKIIRCTNYDTNAFRVTSSSLTNTGLRSHTKSNMKTTQMITAMTSTRKSTNVATKKKTLRLQNDGEDFSCSSMLDEFPITSVQQASDCFRMGKFINQFRRICLPEAQSNASVNTSKTEYFSINSLSPFEDDATDSTSPDDDSHQLCADSEDDNIVCDISTQADQARLCPAKQAHDLVLGKTDASLAKKCLMASDAPHLNTKALIQKLDEVAKTVDLDVSTILEEQTKDPVLATVRSWSRKNTPSDTKLPAV